MTSNDQASANSEYADELAAVLAEHNGDTDSAIELLTDMSWERRSALRNTMDNLIDEIGAINQHEGIPEPD